eukprot:8099766-Ditylum_brightwellii.AAC.1
MEWTKTAPSNVTTVGNALGKTRIESQKVKEHVDLVWADTQQGSAADRTPKYFKNFGAAKPADDAGLQLARNNRRLKHTMCRKMPWNSFKLKF